MQPLVFRRKLEEIIPCVLVGFARLDVLPVN